MGGSKGGEVHPEGKKTPIAVEEQRHAIAGMSCSPVVWFTKNYVENHHNTISNRRTPDFVSPLEQVNK